MYCKQRERLLWTGEGPTAFRNVDNFLPKYISYHLRCLEWSAQLASKHLWTFSDSVSCATVREHLRACSLQRGWTWSNSTFCPHSVFMCFIWIWEQTAIISVHNYNWSVFITETVFTARYGLSFYVILIDLLYRRLVAVLTPRRAGCNFRPFLVRFVVYRVAVVQVSLRVLRVSTIAPYSFIHMLLFLQGKKRAKPGTLQKSMLFRKSASIG